MNEALANHTESKKVLILSYYWPPSGGPGVQRMLKLVKYLPTQGWEPIVLTVAEGSYPAIDTSLLKEVPEDCQVYATKSIEFFSLFKVLTGRKKDAPIEPFLMGQKRQSVAEKLAFWVRQNMLIPDARIGWIPFAVEEGKKIIEREKPALILSSGPPSSIHLSAKRLARLSGLPWVADFRDPWSKANYIIEQPRSRWASRLDYRLEQSVIRKADAVTVISKGVGELLEAQKKAVLIPNGFDGAEFAPLQKQRHEKFCITFTGHIYSFSNPNAFFKALAVLRNDYGHLLEIRLVGKLDQQVNEAIAEEGVNDMITRIAYVPHDQAIQEMVNADMLLLPLPKVNTKGVLSGKVFDYLGTGNYILTIGDTESEAAELIRNCNAGEVFDHDADVAPAIIRQIEKWKAGERHQPNEEVVARYDRRQIARQFAALFNQLAKK
ncbi:MAG: glycosyltransferase [Haliscomenobacter sp.]